MTAAQHPRVVSREDWLAARRAHMKNEKALTRLRDLVSRAPLTKLQAYKARLGWQFEWVSSFGTRFNYDFGVSFTPESLDSGELDYNFGTITVDPRYRTEELPGVSVFCTDAAGTVFHTYSTYARGLDELLGANHYLDLTPKGRDDAAHPEWPRRRDEY